jgi:chromosome segregation ATPase
MSDIVERLRDQLDAMEAELELDAKEIELLREDGSKLTAERDLLVDRLVVVEAELDALRADAKRLLDWCVLNMSGIDTDDDPYSRVMKEFDAARSAK